MNGKAVDFGTVVRDLTWSPDGSKAVFIDGSGNLVVANPDGSGKRTAARNPGGQTWSHPAWQYLAGDNDSQVPAKNQLFFAVSQGGTTRLESVPAAAENGTPTQVTLYGEEGAPLPQTGNVWPTANGKYGETLYANTGDGKVYIRDEYTRQQGAAITAGSQPALAPDGEHVVFVRSSGGHDHLFELDFSNRTNPKDLTPNATTDCTEPTWSPDGRTIAFRTPNGISTLPVDGSAAPTQVSTVAGLPAYRG
ncbi:hypothetical protein GCM10009665_78040 [Kitasatospora nipponensis]|uniref:WD40 repeat protein n=2 Tax=Kitasatospora nipponensis TaxID=258049 RepID=A0ABN1T9P8_9ACTN